ncbi:hypothetical protein BY996DRAFT_7233071 [Phakopsora pachyrhizi]|nr:hypothetical protein BY996DRAFT_7233071 [Phakopsora pachyrhizi]
MPGGGGPGPAPIVGGLPNIPVGVGSLPFPSIVESTHRGGEAPHQLRNVGRKDNQYSGPGGQFGQVNYGSAPPNLGGISGIVPNLGGIGGSVPNLGGMGGIIGNSGHTVSASGRGVVGGGVRGGYGGSGGHGGHGSYGGQGGSGVLVGGGGGGGGGLLGSLPIPNVGGAMPYSSRSVTTGRETNGGGILGPLPIPNVGSLNPASIMSGIPQLPNMQGGGGSGGGINIRQPGNGYQIQGPSGYKFNGGRAGTGPFRISNGNNYQYSGHKSGSVEGYF